MRSFMYPVLLLLLSVVVVLEATTFELFQLPAASWPRPEPYCNDGTQARVQ